MKEFPIRVLSVQPDDIVIGGVQMRSIDLAVRLKSENVRTTILVATEKDNTKPGPVSRLAHYHGVSAIRYRGLNRPRRLTNWRTLLHNLKWMVTGPASILRACGAIRNSDADIVHVNGLMNLVPAVAARITGRKLVWTLEGDHYPEALIRAIRPAVLILSHQVVCVADKLSVFYLGDRFRRRAMIIRNPVDVDRFASVGQNREELCNKFEIKSSDLVVGSIGNIVPSKGWKYFIEAARIIVDTNPNTKFLIVGPESDAQKDYARGIRQYIRCCGLEGHIIMAGFRRDVTEILYIFDVFMMASIMEGVPLAILEAMAANVPVIATNVGGVSEQVIHEKTGILCPPKNPVALAKACNTLIRHPEMCRRFTRQGQQHVRKNYSLDQCADQYSSLYRKLYDAPIAA